MVNLSLKSKYSYDKSYTRMRANRKITKIQRETVRTSLNRTFEEEVLFSLLDCFKTDLAGLFFRDSIC